jgi:GAF domain-containing protein
MKMDSSESAAPHAALLHRISGIVSSGRTLEAMLQELVGLAADVTNSDACLVYLIDPASDEIVLRASQLPHSAELGNLLLGMGEGITGWVAEHRAVVSLPSSASRDSRFRPFPALVEDTYEALLSVPLVASGAVIGVLNVHHREPHAHAAEQIALLSFIGEQMGGAIARARLEEENARLQEETLVMKRELETRKLVERAKGILQQERHLTEEEAYLYLRNESRRQRRPMRELAETIIRDEETGRSSAL